MIVFCGHRDGEKNSLICTVNIVLEYIKYWWKAKDRHGIHSPFTYDLSDKCLKSSINEEFKRKRSELYSYLFTETKLIQRQDLGAGSKRHQSSAPLSAIFKSSSSKGKTADLLYRLTNYYRPKMVLELGANIGIGTIHLAAGNPESRVISVEGCSNTAAVARENIARIAVSNAAVITSDFSSFLASNQHTYDLIFIDGHHDGKALLKYVETLSSFVHDETIILVDDIRWSDSMFTAWKKLIADQHFHLTIDLFRCGILMKRPHQQKEDFVVWY
jgi:predicted O-methyltransferase YrrM